MSRTNKPIDVFKYINMTSGPEWINQATGEKSRCWPFTGGLNKEGRPYFTVNGEKLLAYRLVYRLVKGDDMGGRIHRHMCDNQICCNPDHAIAGDHQENMNDMKERERHGLTHHTVKLIKRQIALNMSDQTIHTITGVDRKVINNIRNEVNYAHVKLDEEEETQEEDGKGEVDE